MALGIEATIKVLEAVKNDGQKVESLVTKDKKTTITIVPKDYKEPQYDEREIPTYDTFECKNACVVRVM
jgi:hypothetical protein